MIFGYTVFDPVFVVAGSLWALWLLLVRPNRLMLYLPAALSIYAIFPFVTLLTLADIVPILMLIVVFLRGKVVVPRFTRPWLSILLLVAVIQAVVGLGAGDADISRVVLRALYYVALLMLFLFTLNACRNQDNYHLLLHGAAIIAGVHVVYGLYQVLAVNFGLPMRGILRGIEGVDVAMEGTFLRINGFADEPKRLGYVLAIGALAFLEMARRSQGIARRWLRIAGAIVLAVSILTFAGSYFLALALTSLTLVVFYPRFLKGVVVAGLLGVLAIPLFPDTSQRLWDSFVEGFDRRTGEFETGIAGEKVYRQEFFVEEYLINHPETALTGVGIGRSNAVLHTEFGDGAGYEGGYLLPLNSEIFQMMFDLGGLATLIVYGTLVMLIFRAWRRREIFLMLALIFLGMQSLSIMVMQYLVVFMGAALARMPARQVKDIPLQVMSVKQEKV